MSFEGREEVEMTNVVPLFSTHPAEFKDILQELSDEASIWSDEAEEEITFEADSKRLIVSENQFPDQSMYILDQQIMGLKERLAKLKFYLSDLDDLLPG